MKPSTTRIERFMGLRSDVAPERMSVGDLIEALNVRLDESGRPVRRGGRSAPVLSNSTHSLWGDGEMAFGVIGGVLSRIHPDYTTTPLASGIASVRTHYVRLNERVYWTNGVQAGVIEHDENRSWGLDVPVMIQASPSSGQLPAGRYQYTLVYMRADGQESGAGASNVIELPADSGLAIVAPAVPAGVVDVTHAVLYLSKPGGETLYRALEIAVGTLGRYSGHGGELVHPLQTQFLSPPVPADAIAWFAGRMWLGVGDLVLPSAAFSPELFDLRAYLPVKGNVTMLAPLANHTGMFVGTDTHTFFLSGADPEAMTLVEKQADGGVIGALVYVPSKFFGKDGAGDHDIPVWATAKGLFAGMGDGTVVSLTQDRYPLTLAARGASYFDTDLKQVVFSAI